MNNRDPIIVGVGQMTHKPENPGDFLHPLQAMEKMSEQIGAALKNGDEIGCKAGT